MKFIISFWAVNHNFVFCKLLDTTLVYGLFLLLACHIKKAVTS